MADPRAPRRGRGGARARLGRARQPPRGGSGCCAAGSTPEDVAHAVRRTRARVRARPQRQPVVRLARARRGARGRRARRAAPAQLPARVRAGAVLHAAARTARAATAATRARACGSTAAAARARRRSPTRPGSRCGSAGSPRTSTRSSSRARSRSRRLRELGAPVGDRAHVVGSVQREIADALARRRGPLRARRRPAHAREGLRRRDRRRPAAGLPLVVAGDGPAGGRAARPRRRRRRALHRASSARPSWRTLRRDAAAAVVPSRFAEILPLAALEAMAAGLPLAAADAGGLTEVVPERGPLPARRRRRARGAAHARCGATRRRASGRWRWRASASPPRPSPPAARALRGTRLRRARPCCEHHAPDPSDPRQCARDARPGAGGAARAASLKKGIWGPVRVDGVSQFPIYRELGAGVYHTSLRWAKVATRRPVDPRNPRDPAYALAVHDRRRCARGGALAGSGSRS